MAEVFSGFGFKVSGALVFRVKFVQLDRLNEQEIL